MKKIILAITVAAFAVAAQAGEKACPATAKNKAACTEKAACADKDKATCCEKKGADAKGTCPFAKAAKAAKKVQSPRGAETSK